MNPPSALHGAMSRDRKPFTYTPGGLDLSEIKSSRMAARLMRNAMNEGVPEQPKNIQSPPISSNPVAVPNFNCLPVQVFPAFNLPANPKSLLRTRSNPGQPRDLPIQRIPPPLSQASQLVNNSRTPSATQYDTLNNSQINNNRPVSMFEYGSPTSSFTPRNYGNDNYVHNPSVSSFPEISYDAEYLRMPPKTDERVLNTVPSSESLRHESNVNHFSPPNTELLLPFDETRQNQPIFNDSKHETENEKSSLQFNEKSIYEEYLSNAFKPEINISENTEGLNECKNMVEPFLNTNRTENIVGNSYKSVIPNKDNDTLFPQINENINNAVINLKLEKDAEKSSNDYENIIKPEVANNNLVLDMFDKPTTNYSTFTPENANLIEDLSGSEDQKKEVKIVKKQVIEKETNVKDQNGSSDQNGDSEVEAVIKLPAKKSAAKTETKVEVTKKTLPDGSVEEVKKTITKTTIDGRTEIKTKTETTIIPKEDDEEEIEEVEEEEEENGETITAEENKPDEVAEESSEEKVKPSENGQDNIIKTEERSETTTTTSKKVVVIQDEKEEDKEEDVEEEEEETEETEPVTFIIKQPALSSTPTKKEVADEAAEEEEEENVEEEKDAFEDTDVADKENKIINNEEEKPIETKDDEYEEEVEEEEEYEEAEEKDIVENISNVSEPESKSNDNNIEVSNDITQETEDEENKIEKKETITGEDDKISETKEDKQEQTQDVTEVKVETIIEKQELKEEKQSIPEESIKPSEENPETPQLKVPLREPSVPLEKVEDIEIKPLGLGDFLTKTSTESREIITNITEKPTGLLTEINRIENIVTVNRTTKTLDRAYEDITQQGIPTVKTYFTPHIDKIMASPQPARPYQPVYPPEPVTERRHSLLLERLSVERQIPSDSYQNNNQYRNETVEEQRQWSQEPQAEVLTVSNVKPSQITNQQWYQQRENAIYNNVAPSPQPQPAAPSWTQPKTQPQPVYQPQPQYQPSPQPQYVSAQPQQHLQYQAPLQTQPQYQPTYTENIQETSSNTYQNTYSSYTPKPTNWAPNNTKPISPIPTIITPNQPNQYDYLNKDVSESYQKTTENFSSSYVPPPWEQDCTYVAPDTSSQNFYQPPPQTSSFSPAPNQGWKPNPPPSKFNKTPPTAYIPPKPNQSFVKPVIVEPPRMPGRKTYYSEYERRYISVPESTYIPGESKFQPQPDPSPAYYYDNNEPAETVEPQWRRELREFTEKSQTTTTTETNVKPPWEAETKYAKASEPSYTPTPTWSQTVRPQSWRERSFESEFVSQEWPKTNTLGRGRPLSSYGKEIIPERTRGVSVDRYNPNSYQSPVAAEHPPVQTHTHIPPAPHATGYHNPSVPAYHARASAEPREQVSYQQPRNYREARASPFQSRSFKYLQWITGTED